MASFGAWLDGLLGRRGDASPRPPVPRPRERSDRSRSFGEDANDFAVAMFEALRGQPGNLFFSPFSLRTALGMAHAGARGETAEQMREALRISSPDEAQHRDAGTVVERLEASGAGACEMAVANALWGQEGAPLREEFLDLVARHYRSGLNLVDFRRDAEKIRIAINEWVEEKTREKIRDLMPPGGLAPDTRLVLVNAVYFKGLWALRFDQAATRDEPFRLEGGKKVRTPLMHQEEPVRYLHAPGYQAVDLEYLGGGLSMLVLLPDRKNGLADLEAKLSARMLDDCARRMEVCDVKIFLPRFKVTWGTVDLCGALAGLGMTAAFDRSRADFSGINGRRPPDEAALFISSIFHKAFVAVNEEGTEAAAATAVGVLMTATRYPSIPPRIPVFRADHPFLFAIRDRKSDAILFLGRMADPTRAD